MLWLLRAANQIFNISLTVSPPGSRQYCPGGQVYRIKAKPLRLPGSPIGWGICLWGGAFGLGRMGPAFCAFSSQERKSRSGHGASRTDYSGCPDVLYFLIIINGVLRETGVPSSFRISPS